MATLCEQVFAQLCETGTAPMPDHLQAHLRTCQECQEAQAVLDESFAWGDALRAQRDTFENEQVFFWQRQQRAIQDALSADAAPASPASHAWGRWTMLACGAAAALLLLLWSSRLTQNTAPSRRTALSLASFSAPAQASWEQPWTEGLPKPEAPAKLVSWSAAVPSLPQQESLTAALQSIPRASMPDDAPWATFSPPQNAHPQWQELLNTYASLRDPGTHALQRSLAPYSSTPTVQTPDLSDASESIRSLTASSRTLQISLTPLFQELDDEEPNEQDDPFSLDSLPSLKLPT